MEKVYLVGAERSPMAFVPYPKNGGKSESSICALRPEELAAQVRDRMIEKTNLPLESTEIFRLGSLLSKNIEPSLFHAPAKTTSRMPGTGRLCKVNAVTFDRACATGLAAVEDLVEEIWLGRARLGVVAGLDMLSRATKEELDAVLTNPETGKTIAELADATAHDLGLTRAELDEYGFESYQRATAHKYDHGSRLVPIYLPGNDQPVLVSDEGSEQTPSLKLIQTKLKLLPGCKMITSAHSSKLADAAAYVALASGQGVRDYGLRILARVAAAESYSVADPKDFAVAPNGAIALALKRAGLSVGELDHIIINEASAPSPIHFMRTFGVSREKVNAWGGAIAFGHPFGATGVALLVMLLTMLEYEDKRLGAVVVCAAGGEASACIIERI